MPMHRTLTRTTISIICTVVLMGVFTLYFQPDFLLTLANQVWGCF